MSKTKKNCVIAQVIQECPSEFSKIEKDEQYMIDEVAVKMKANKKHRDLIYIFATRLTKQ